MWEKMMTYLLAVVLSVTGCWSSAGSGDDDDEDGGAPDTSDTSGADADADSDSDSDGDSDGDSDSDGDTDTDTDSDTVATCGAILVYCNSAPPSCPEGSFAEADPCQGGYCPERCWTGDCLPCGEECTRDEDCAIVGLHGCCGMAGDCARGCFWAEPTTILDDDPCYFPGGCPVPDPPPAGCPTECVDDPRCVECPHCGPDLARCEGGTCVSAWSQCEPACACD